MVLGFNRPLEGPLGGGVPTSGFTPSGSPVGWWPADQITGLSDGDPCGTFPDQSGNSNDLIQATAGKKPTYKTSVLNGKPVLRSDGGDAMQVDFTNINLPNTIFLVGKCTVDPVGHWYQLFCDGHTEANMRHAIGYHDGTGELYSYAGGELTGSSDTTWNTFLTLTGLFNGASSDLRKNGSSIIAGSTGTTHNLGGLTIFASVGQTSEWLAGDIAEVIVYDGNETPSDNETGLRTKYAHY